MSKLRVMAVFGTRPEAIKMAPVVRELARHDGVIDTIVAVTAQHREMLDQVLKLFCIPVHHDLNIMKAGQTLEEVTTAALQGLAAIYRREKPDMVLVHGDTTTTFVAALAAYYQQIPVGHVEAGLRTNNKYSPFPEEMNRRLAGALADVHFAPTATSKSNLLREGVDPTRIFITGNTVIDALLATVREEYRFTGTGLSALDPNKRWLLVTAHRRENWGEPMRRIFLALKELVQAYPDVEVIFPVHKNPRVRSAVAEVLAEVPRVHLVEPLDYLPLVNLMRRAYLVLTDSGGMQEEAPSLGKPVLVLRDTTERPEAVEAGTVRLVGTDRARIVAEARRLLDSREDYLEMANAVNPYGDGRAAARTVEALLYHFGRSARKPEDFAPIPAC